MEETLYNPDGAPVAYIAYQDDNTIYLWDGRPVAFLMPNSSLYGFNGKHLGWFENGIVWDLQGYQVGYNQSALPVYAKYEPYKGYKRYKPYKSYLQYEKYKPYYKRNRSTISLPQFLIVGSK